MSYRTPVQETATFITLENQEATRPERFSANQAPPLHHESRNKCMLK